MPFAAVLKVHVFGTLSKSMVSVAYGKFFIFFLTLQNFN